ncbi:HNH endonuclease [Hoeflea sp. WL0058]|uniref:HNH endonuclease n=1 Tax=Flavimaribacter sediminis TaxID=2865987 RepID=A0AAE3D125_9HYPH|nr:HNH endonuclease [Flavimaribacter sediminis]MBW8639170.1 HNH endonuclease [Flavimaribacter sediminis]
MISVEDALGRVTGDQRTALQWYRDHTGHEVLWADMQDFSREHVRIVNQAKGIYKPAYTDYALSVRQTLEGPYADRPVDRRADGSWQYLYYQENQNPADRDKAATNRGLMNCMEDGVPVGVLLQRTPKPGVTYDVLGLALVTDWKDGYFVLEGFGEEGHARTSGDHTAAQAREAAEKLSEADTDFDPNSITDEREKRVAQITQRRGQAVFRKAVVAAYRGCCAVTGYDAIEALDAAHISPYRGAASNHVQNGLLLRADIHDLFDLGHLAIDTEDMTVVLSDALLETEYSGLQGQPVRLPTEAEHQPNKETLAAHRSWANI